MKNVLCLSKITLQFKPGVEMFSTQLHDSSILKKPEISKSGRVTELQTHLSMTTFHQQEIAAIQNTQRRQNPKRNSRNTSMESINQTTASQTTQHVIHQSSGHQRGLSKLVLTEISGDSLECPEWEKLFNIIAHQQWLASHVSQKRQFLDRLSAHRHTIEGHSLHICSQAKSRCQSST